MTRATVAFLMLGRRYDLEMNLEELPAFLANLQASGYEIINVWTEVIQTLKR